MLLKELFEFMPKSSHPASYGQKQGAFPFFTSSNTIDKYCYEADYNGEYLIVGDGGTGNCKYYNGKFSVSDHNYVLKPIEGTNCKLLQYFLMKDNYKILNEGFKGIGIKNVSKTYIQNIDFKKNNSYSDEYIVNSLIMIEKIIKKEQLQLDKLNELIKSRFNEMFSAFPKVELSQISQIIMGQSPESTAYNDDGIGLPFFQGKADYGEKYTVVKHYTKKWNKEAKRGYVLMSVRAPVGPVNIASTDCAIGRGLCAMNAKPNKANNEFLYNALNSMQQEIVLSGKDGSTFAAINKDQVYKLLLPQAPIELQNDFSEFVHHFDKLKFSL